MKTLLTIFLLVGVSQAGNLKIMPLGDSLTAGGYNLDGNWHVDGGYREPLWKLLTDANLKIDFVGRLSNGSFPDSDHEGYSGYKIHEVEAVAQDALELAKPDIVLLLLGSNDLFRNYELATANQRISKLIQKILNHHTHPKLFVSSVLPTTNLVFNNRIKIYNKALHESVEMLQKNNPNVFWVNMHKESNLNPSQDLTDGVHPTAVGYKKMAVIWYQAIARTLNFSMTSFEMHTLK